MAPVLRAMNTPEEIIGGAFTYLRIMFAGIPIIMAYNVLASILRALGDSKTPLYAMVIASILNIGLICCLLWCSTGALRVPGRRNGHRTAFWQRFTVCALCCT